MEGIKIKKKKRKRDGATQVLFINKYAAKQYDIKQAVI